MKVPGDLYTRSPRVYRGLEELSSPFHDATVMVTNCGRICWKARKINFSHVFAGQKIGITQVGERVWLVTFMHHDLGYYRGVMFGASRARHLLATARRRTSSKKLKRKMILSCVSSDLGLSVNVLRFVRHLGEGRTSGRRFRLPLWVAC